MSFPLIFPMCATLSSVWSAQYKKFGMNILKLEYISPLPIMASSYAKKHMTQKHYVAFVN